MVCGSVRTVIAHGSTDVAPAAGRARSWRVVACAAGGWHVWASRHGHDAWPGAPGHHAWCGRCGSSGRVGTGMACGAVHAVPTCGSVGVVPVAGWAWSRCVVACAVGVIGGRVGTVTVWSGVWELPAAGWARSWCAVVRAAITCGSVDMVSVAGCRVGLCWHAVVYVRASAISDRVGMATVRVCVRVAPVAGRARPGRVCTCECVLRWLLRVPGDMGALAGRVVRWVWGESGLCPRASPQSLFPEGGHHSRTFVLRDGKEGLKLSKLLCCGRWCAGGGGSSRCTSCGQQRGSCGRGGL